MIIVTGAGRSGTSFTAKVLCEAGANFKGDWYDDKIRAGMEHPKVANLNKLLRAGSASSLEEAVSMLGIPEIKSELSGGVVIKDPKFMLTLDLWLAGGYEIEHIIYCARDYKEIFDSSMKSGRGGIGDINGLFIPTYESARIYFTYLERTFFNQAKAAKIPVTIISFPKSAQDFSEIEKLAFLVDKKNLRDAWEKVRTPEKIGSQTEKIPKQDEAFADSAQKDNKIKELLVNEATLIGRISELELKVAIAEKMNNASLPKKIERSFRKKFLYPIKDLFRGKVNGN
jgi:hypothetical protein